MQAAPLILLERRDGHVVHKQVGCAHIEDAARDALFMKNDDRDLQRIQNARFQIVPRAWKDRPPADRSFRKRACLPYTARAFKLTESQDHRARECFAIV